MKNLLNEVTVVAAAQAARLGDVKERAKFCVWEIHKTSFSSAAAPSPGRQPSGTVSYLIANFIFDLKVQYLN